MSSLYRRSTYIPHTYLSAYSTFKQMPLILITNYLQHLVSPALQLLHPISSYHLKATPSPSYPPLFPPHTAIYKPHHYQKYVKQTSRRISNRSQVLFHSTYSRTTPKNTASITPP